MGGGERDKRTAAEDFTRIDPAEIVWGEQIGTRAAAPHICRRCGLVMRPGP